jgi:photosystem II stability/assembly factor-like uncharacterized protein
MYSRSFPGILLLLLLSAFLVPPPACAQLPWKPLAQKINSYGLRDMAYLKNGSFIAVGDSGTYLRSQDSLSFWLMDEWETAGLGLRSIAFRDSLNGIICGEEGIQFLTTDGGMRWFPGTAFTNHTLLKMHFWSPDSGIALSARGELWLTRDGGHSWSVAFIASVDSLIDASRLPGGGLLVVGENGCILHSMDEGNSWILKKDLPLDDYTCIAVSPDSSRIAISGRSRKIWHSTDAGAVWAQEQWKNSEAIHDIFFADHRRMYVIGQSSLHQIDFANHCDVGLWAAVENGVGVKAGIAIKILNSDGSSTFSSNGWNGWYDITLPEWLTRMDVVSDGTVWAWRDSYYYTYLISAEHGVGSFNSWKYLSGKPNIGGLLFAFVDRTGGICIHRYSNEDHIMKSEDGGKTWIHLANESSPGLSSVIMVSREIIYGCTGSEVVRSSDGGITWSTLHREKDVMTAIEFSRDGRNGIVAMRKGGVLVTNDWGEHWDVHRAPSGVDFVAVAIHENSMAAVGSGGVVFVSHTYGETWEEFTMPFAGKLTGVTLASSKALFVCGEDGVVFSTRGLNTGWTREPVACGGDAIDIEALDDGTVLLLTTCGAFYRSIEQVLLGIDVVSPPAIPQRLSLGSPYPQPASESIRVPLSLDRAGVVRVDLFDLLGRHRTTLFEGELEAKSYTLSLPIPSVDAAMYVIRAVSAEGIASRRVVIKR